MTRKSNLLGNCEADTNCLGLSIPHWASLSLDPRVCQTTASCLIPNLHHLDRDKWGLVGRPENRMSGEDGFCLRMWMRKLTFQAKDPLYNKAAGKKKSPTRTPTIWMCFQRTSFLVCCTSYYGNHLGLYLRPNNINVASCICFQLLPLKTCSICSQQWSIYSRRCSIIVGYLYKTRSIQLIMWTRHSPHEANKSMYNKIAFISLLIWLRSSSHGYLLLYYYFLCLEILTDDLFSHWAQVIRCF